MILPGPQLTSYFTVASAACGSRQIPSLTW
jgi:hypothetical protein